MRTTVIVLHRWLALAASLFILVIALTGSAIVFEGAIDRAAHPSLWRVQPTGRPLSLDSLAARARGAFTGRVSAISLAPVLDRAWVVSIGSRQVFVNPYTGSLLGSRTAAERESTLARRLHVLHVSLMAKEPGRSVVAISTIVCGILVLSGLVLWWRDRLVRVNTAGSWKRIIFDLHHAFGVVAAATLLVVTTSGAWVHYDGMSRLVVRLLNETPPSPVPPQPPAKDGATEASFDAVAAAGAETLIGARVMSVSLPPAPEMPAFVGMRFPEDRTPGGRSRVYVDRFSARVLQVANTRTAPLGTRLDNLKRSIHTGDVLGRPTEAIWLMTSLMLVSQVLSGLSMWWNGRPARAAARQRATRPPARAGPG